MLYGRNPHHIVEAQFKAVARALRAAAAYDPRSLASPPPRASLTSQADQERDPERMRLTLDTAMIKVVVLDYGSGNLRSAERALARVGADVTVTADLRRGR